MTSPVLLLVNPSSGSDDKASLIERAHKSFEGREHPLEVVRLRSGDDIAARARSAISGKPHAVIAAGGDGTVSAVASVLVDSGTRFGVVPAGTLNHFAKALGIPMELDAALAIAAGDTTRMVDVGEVNGRIFVNNSSIGLYPSIVVSREKQQHRLGRGKWPAFAWAIFAALRRYPFLFVRLRTGNEELVRRTPFVFIGNNEYVMEGLRIGTRARLDGGVLGVYMPHHTGRCGLLALAVRALFSRLRDSRELDAVSLPGFSIETPHRRLPVALDGEVQLLDLPLVYRLRPRALTVLAPPADGDAA